MSNYILLFGRGDKIEKMLKEVRFIQKVTNLLTNPHIFIDSDIVRYGNRTFTLERARILWGTEIRPDPFNPKSQNSFNLYCILVIHPHVIKQMK